MKNLSINSTDPTVKNKEEKEEQETVLNHSPEGIEEGTEDEVDDNEEHEFINPGDLDAVDPDDIALGEEYF